MELKQIALQTLKNCMAVKEGEELVSYLTLLSKFTGNFYMV